MSEPTSPPVEVLEDVEMEPISEPVDLDEAAQELERLVIDLPRVSNGDEKKVTFNIPVPRQNQSRPQSASESREEIDEEHNSKRDITPPDSTPSEMSVRQVDTEVEIEPPIEAVAEVEYVKEHDPQRQEKVTRPKSARPGSARSAWMNQAVDLQPVVHDEDKSLEGYEKIPDNPGLYVKKGSEQTMSATRAQTANALITRIHQLPMRPHTAVKSTSTNSGPTQHIINLPAPSGPGSHGFSSVKGERARSPPRLVGHTQSARINLDRYRIEQIALRRLRHVIDSNEVEPEHLEMVDLIAHSNPPASLISTHFGSQYRTPTDLRILVLQSIDRSQRARARAVPRPATGDSGKAVPKISGKRPATTPNSVLRILEQVEGRRGKTVGGGGRVAKTFSPGFGGLRGTSGRVGTAGTPSITAGRQIPLRSGLAVVGHKPSDKTPVDAGSDAVVDPTAALSGEQLLDMLERRRQRHLQL
ncbi:hypothetical protein BC832DRAFT_592588 [Gaertneriomyces semiglobifer]|nr:hypothetical protein BC832DRAFT_592588 [Gaertneriomyces semiglobifer]